MAAGDVQLFLRQKGQPGKYLHCQVVRYHHHRRRLRRRRHLLAVVANAPQLHCYWIVYVALVDNDAAVLHLPKPR